MKTALFGAGCFWGVEETFARIPGVTDTAAGYANGTIENPTYEQVCTGQTGHAEVVEVTYDPERVSYDDLLNAFWQLHDPTTLNRQGPDIGTQYRSGIFYADDAQMRVAETSKKALDDSNALHAPVATEISPAQTFYRAEEYHQRYLAKRGMSDCH